MRLITNTSTSYITTFPCTISLNKYTNFPKVHILLFHKCWMVLRRWPTFLWVNHVCVGMPDCPASDLCTACLDGKIHVIDWLWVVCGKVYDRWILTLHLYTQSLHTHDKRNWFYNWQTKIVVTLNNHNRCPHIGAMKFCLWVKIVISFLLQSQQWSM